MAQPLHKQFNPTQTPQSKPIPGKVGKRQVKNDAGGYVFQIDKWEQLKRFLTRGTSGGTYYCGEQKLTVENAECVIECLDEDTQKTVKIIEEISTEGRAPRNDPALFALALASSKSEYTELFTLKDSLLKVARIPTHLFIFIKYATEMRRWGRALKTAVAHWYESKNCESLIYNALKYRQREGWTHGDVIRLSHPSPVHLNETTNERKPVFEYMRKGGSANVPHFPERIKTFETMKIMTEYSKPNLNKILDVIKNDKFFTWEMLPTWTLTHTSTWTELLPHLPMTALLRNLGRMTSIGVFDCDKNLEHTVKHLTNKSRLQKSRIHPINVLIAMLTYRQGQGVKGSLNWTPHSNIIDALHDAFYLSFKNVEPTNKRLLVAVDISGSMGWINLMNVHGFTPRMAAAALCTVFVQTENHTDIVAFSHTLTPVPISKRQRLDDVVKTFLNYGMGATDCALPMIYAYQNRKVYDAFIIYTDNETWYGSVHPKQALDRYRKEVNPEAKLIVHAMESTNKSIADPLDPGMLDISGFDSAAPQITNDFIRGSF